MLLAVVALGVSSHAQPGAMLRGQVLEEDGKPIAEVDVELQFKGAVGYKPQNFAATTNDRGYFSRVGLPSGAYKIVFSKSGYRTYVIEMQLSLGGLSEIEPVKLPKAPVAPPPGPPKPTGEGGKPAAEGGTAAGGVPTGEAAKLAGAIKDTFAKAAEAARAGKFDDAEALYKDVLAKMPNLAPAHFNLGYVYRSKKDWAAAEAAFQKAVALEPGRADTHVALAGTYRAAGDPQKALDVLVKAAPSFEQDGGFQYELGIAYLNVGRNDEATATLKRAEALDPANIETQFYLGTLAVGRNDIAEATSRLQKYVAGTGQNAGNLATARGILKTITR